MQMKKNNIVLVNNGHTHDVGTEHQNLKELIKDCLLERTAT